MQISRQERRLAEKRKRTGKTPYPGATAAVFGQLQSAMNLHLAGNHAAAEAGYRAVLADEPDHPHALNLLGVLACEIGAPELGCDLIRQAIAINGQIAEYHTNLSEAALQCGRATEALAAAQLALKVDRRFARAPLVLGNALRHHGEGRAAIEAYRQALALAPDDPEAKVGFARCCVDLGVAELDAVEPLLVRAMTEAWSRPSELVHCIAAALAKQPAVAALLEAAVRDDGAARISAALADGSLAGVLSRPLVVLLLKAAPIADPSFERLILHLRRAYLERVVGGSRLPKEALDLLAALAQASFLGDYALAETAAEAETIDRLAATELDADRIALLAAYRPLWRLDRADRLVGASLPPALADLVRLQVSEPLADRNRAGAIPALTPIAAGVSEQVREQYEENPYPRWTQIGMRSPGLSLQAHLRRAFKIDVPDTADILIAGCGTGQEPIELAMKCRGTGARILAVDLSLASLAYALRQTETLGLAVRYAQADIVRLDRLDDRFDVITCNGVLHHLADPVGGWRNLVRLLKPAGIMKISLYSEASRRAVVAARELIARRGWPATADGMRAARAAILALPAEDPAREVVRSPDFYGLNTCRDLLFHVQEHRFTLPELASILGDLGLRFLGFDVDALTSARYRIRFPADPEMTDLGNWHAFEGVHPDTFGAMYQFWATPRRAGAAQS